MNLIAYLSAWFSYCLRPNHRTVSDRLPSEQPYQYSHTHLVQGFFCLFFLQIILLQLVALIIDIEALPHAMEDFSIEFSSMMMLLIGVVVAPVIEELLFRFPLRYLSRYFAVLFYLFTCGFAVLHVFNFSLELNQYWMTPFLVLPQLIIGFYLGFVRMHFSIWHSIAIHALNNLIPLTIMLIGKSMGIEL